MLCVIQSVEWQYIMYWNTLISEELFYKFHVDSCNCKSGENNRCKNNINLRGSYIKKCMSSTIIEKLKSHEQQMLVP